MKLFTFVVIALFASIVFGHDDDDDDYREECFPRGDCFFQQGPPTTCEDAGYSKFRLLRTKRPKEIGSFDCNATTNTYDGNTGEYLSTSSSSLTIQTCYNSSCGCLQTKAFFGAFQLSDTLEYGIPGYCLTCWQEQDAALNKTLYFQTATLKGDVQVPVGITQDEGKVRVVQNTVFSPENNVEVVIRTVFSPDTGFPISVGTLVCSADPSFC